MSEKETGKKGLAKQKRGDVILLSHGTGGEESHALIQNVFLAYLGNSILKKGEDGARVDLAPHTVMTTDSFTVKPAFFPGGDIGKLAICGLCNDLAVMGARPKYLTLTFIIEEGFPIERLHALLESMRQELKNNKVQVVAADTKVIEHRGTQEILISGSGTGEVSGDGCSIYNVVEGNEIVVSGPVGDHGAVIMMERSEFSMNSDLLSDCRSLWPVIQKLTTTTPVKALRDITRGGIATILNEWTNQSGFSIEVNENQIPVRNEVRGFCELLGIDPFHLACEGNFVAALPPGQGEAALSLLHRNGFEQAALIGKFTTSGDVTHPPQVTLHTGVSARRLESLRGEMLPRIC